MWFFGFRSIQCSRGMTQTAERAGPVHRGNRRTEWTGHPSGIERTHREASDPAVG